MAYRNNLLTGITELLVLSILNKMDSYIYEIVKLIANDSDNRLTLSSNTVYASAYKSVNILNLSGKKEHVYIIILNPKGGNTLKNYKQVIRT